MFVVHQVAFTTYCFCLSLGADVDECQVGTHRCGAGQICHNFPGTYRCECQTGYQYDSLRKVCNGMYVRSHCRWENYKQTACEKKLIELFETLPSKATQTLQSKVVLEEVYLFSFVLL